MFNQNLKTSKWWFFFSVLFLFIFKKSNKKLDFNDIVFFVICQYKGGQKWLQGRWRPCILLLNITLMSAIFSLKKMLFLNIFFVKSGLTHCTISFLFRLHFFLQTVFTVTEPKATNSRVSDCYLTPTQQCSAISWREQVNFQWDDVRFVLDQGA